MQYFIDTATQEPYVFEDNVLAEKSSGGAYTFSFESGSAPSKISESGMILSWTPIFTKILTPSTLQPMTEAQAAAAAEITNSGPTQNG